LKISMDILLSLPYTTFDDFYISVKKIKYGWMHFDIGKGKRYISYAASCVGDPLNDLLDVAVLFTGGAMGKTISYYPNPNYIGNYFYVTHDLEGDLAIWLFKYVDEQLTLVIWNGFPTDMDTLYDLAEADFDDQSFEFRMLDEKPDLTKYLVFAVKGPLWAFARVLINTFQNLAGLKRCGDDNDWGFAYPADQFNFLQQWVAKNNAIIN
jgi:hypothetical protein